MRLADKLSFVRIVFAPVFVFLYMYPADQSSPVPYICLLVLLALVEFTDFLDGYFARKLKQVSDLGKLLDPFADAFLHVSIFITFAVTLQMHFIACVLIFYREFAMLFLRMISIKNGIAVGARPGGKTKTVLYITSCFFTLAFNIGMCVHTPAVDAFFDNNNNLNAVQTIQFVLFALAVLAAYISFIDYLIQFKKQSKRLNQKKA
ncbi:MAG: CDP-diacylglycerol--glycerol-3-phosphate 3-phosphatidyltransferase [Spirochaetaceae bacterium]|jgi:CDP-diacylglycerol--glycerol-3-phosphate 3-phosphatidyltransferase|nr:CDP-diacylglycerol--glycerol-3-phosphate 3-phosphatidyltransferase [Spirochaetaceae bacterium]